MEYQKAYNRNFEALGYRQINKVTGKTQQAKLTEKQYLVYSYLLSISHWNAERKEDHYYVYKNQFKVKDACEIIGISQPTWRTAISKLKELNYIAEEVNGKCYIIFFPENYIPLHLSIITYLLPYGKELKCGGHIVAVYSVIAQYWRYQFNKNEQCCITENQLRQIFKNRTKHKTDADVRTYEMMLLVFENANLINLKRVGRIYEGNPYTEYVIEHVCTETPPNQLKRASNAPCDVKDILKALENSIEMNIE